jgi:hypothetical protein
VNVEQVADWYELEARSSALPTFPFRAQRHVVEALRAAGATDFKIKPWRPQD